MFEASQPPSGPCRLQVIIPAIHAPRAIMHMADALARPTHESPPETGPIALLEEALRSNSITRDYRKLIES